MRRRLDKIALGHGLRQFRVTQIRLPLGRQSKRHFQHDQLASVCMLEDAVTVSETASITIHVEDDAAGAMHDAHAMQIILDFNAIRTNILDRRGAYSTGNQRQVFQSAHALRQRPLHEVVPVFAGRGRDEYRFEIRLRQAHAARGHVQHGAGKVACKHDVAAAAQYQARHGGEKGILQRGLQFGLRSDAYVGGRVGRDAEGIQALEGVIVFDGELCKQGITIILLDYRVKPTKNQRKTRAGRPLSVKMSHL